eukprot:3963255-Alexandrium_andersonii.AAC.1
MCIRDRKSCPIYPEQEFWELPEYVKQLGDPAENKAKVATKTNRNGKLVEGVVVQNGRKGVYKLENSREGGVELAEV